jgi:hypothetical protein
VCVCVCVCIYIYIYIYIYKYINGNIIYILNLQVLGGRKGGPGSSVGIAADYRFDGLGIESRWGRDFSHTSRPPLGSTQPPVEWVPGLSRG